MEKKLAWQPARQFGTMSPVAEQKVEQIQPLQSGLSGPFWQEPPQKAMTQSSQSILPGSGLQLASHGGVDIDVDVDFAAASASSLSAAAVSVPGTMKRSSEGSPPVAALERPR